MLGGPLGYLTAFGGGVASFLSPCVLPLVPGYLSVIASPPPQSRTLEQSRSLGRVALDTALFVGGFAAVFVLLGLSATATGRFLTYNQVLLEHVSGATVCAMAAIAIGASLGRLPFFSREFRLHPQLARYGRFAAPIAGAAFGFGWTPCLGPILASVLAVASAEGHLAEGGLLLAFYAAGMGTCFLAVGLAADSLRTLLSWFSRHGRAISIGSSLVMAALGGLLAFGQLSLVTTALESAFRHLGLGFLVRLG